MQRDFPERERLRAISHLLRHLDNGQALAQNPLLCDLRVKGSINGTFEDLVDRLRGAAFGAVDNLERRLSDPAKRLAQIVRRCELAGEPHRKVMADMAISRAEFYRSLAAGRRLILDEIDWRLVHPNDEACQEGNAFERQMHDAFVLSLNGRAGEAARYLAPIFEQVAGIDRVQVGCFLARLRVTDDLVAEARAYLQAAVAATDDLSGDARELAAAYVAEAQALLQFHRGLGLGRCGVLEQHVAWLKHHGKAEARRSDLLGSLITLQANVLALNGNVSDALVLLESSPAGNPKGSVSLGTHAEHLMLKVSLETALAETDDYVNDCRRLYRFANSRGLPSAAAIALAQQARLRAMRGDDATSDLYAEEAVLLARSCMSPWEQSSVYAIAARVALDGGRSRKALALADRASALAPPRTYPALLAMLRKAEAFHMEGRVRDSLLLSDRLASESSGVRYPHIVGQMLHLNAQNFHALGDEISAKKAITSSVEVLRGTQYAAALARTLASAASLRSAY
jgi:hypothetical protein